MNNNTTAILVALLIVVALLASRVLSRKDATEAHRLVEAGATLVDVRTPAEFAAGHIDGAVNIPVQQLPSRAAELGDKGEPVVVYCQSGARSAAAANTLRGLGFAKVEDLGAKANW